MGFLAAVASSYTKILSFSGRASRSEFWWVMLFQSLVIFGAVGGVIYYVSSGALDPTQLETSLLPYIGVMNLVWIILFTVPATTVMVRRLHDTDHSGWWYWICLVPIIGFLILLFFMVMPGTSGRNRYGTDPSTPTSRRRNAPKTYAPEILAKRAKTEAARRAEIMDYYRKNVANGA